MLCSLQSVESSIWLTAALQQADAHQVFACWYREALVIIKAISCQFGITNTVTYDCAI